MCRLTNGLFHRLRVQTIKQAEIKAVNPDKKVMTYVTGAEFI